MDPITLPLTPEERQAIASDMQAWAQHKAEMERAMLVLRSRADILLQLHGCSERVPVVASFTLSEEGLVMSGSPSDAPPPAQS